LKNRPLQGRGIVVTRPREQARGLASLIEAAGGRALLFPAIEIEDLPWQLPPLEAFDLAIFVSPTAVQQLMRRVPAWPPALAVAAVGSGTRRELERHGLSGVLVPQTGADSEALLAAPQLAVVAGKRIAIIRGQGGRELLGSTLTARGARVEYVECYRRAAPQAAAAPLLEAWARGAVAAVTVSSGEGLDNLLGLLGDAGRQYLAGTPLFVPHARIAEQARARGVREAIVAGPGDKEITASLVAYFDRS
jgi:uroporphyrinogen-III synthase